MGFEAVAFQSDLFFKELVLAYDEIRALTADQLEGSDELAMVQAIIKNHTGGKEGGLNVELVLGYGGFEVDIPDINRNNPLINSYIRHYFHDREGLAMVKNAEQMARGSVNIQTGRVTGVFSEMKSRIYVSSALLLNKKYTSEEFAAATLHEVGHLMTYLEYISRSMTNNQVLAGVSRGLDGSYSVPEKETLLIAARKAMKLSDLDVQELTKSNNKTVVETVIVNAAVKESISALGTNIYDANNWEQLADQYAGRYGAGRHLLTFLDKLSREAGHISFRTTGKYIAMEALKTILLILTIALAVSGGVATLLSMYTAFGWMIFTAVDGLGSTIYDRPGVRAKRIRNEMVENLKVKGLDKKAIEKILEDIAIVDEYLKAVNDRRQWFDVVWGFFSSSQKKRLSAETLQQELESLVANDLFVKAKELTILA
jgi:hypothetical protein